MQSATAVLDIQTEKEVESRCDEDTDDHDDLLPQCHVLVSVECEYSDQCEYNVEGRYDDKQQPHVLAFVKE